jgi:hypothetical protein
MYFTNNDIISGMLNLPQGLPGRAFSMLVERTTSSRPMQTLTIDNGGRLPRVFRRIMYGSVWGEWVEVLNNLNARPFVSNAELVAPNPLSYVISNSATTGFKIRTPLRAVGNEDGMFVFTVRMYTNYNTSDIQFQGYVWGAGTQAGQPYLYAPQARIISGNAARRVIMGLETDGTMYVWIGGANTAAMVLNNSWPGVAVFNAIRANNPRDINTGWTMVRTSADADMPNRYLDQYIQPPMSGDWMSYQSELVPAPGVIFYTQARSCAFESNGRQCIVTQLLQFGGASNMVGTPPASFNWGAAGSHVYPVTGIRGSFRPNNSIYFPCTIMPFGSGAPVSANLQPGYPAYCSVDNQGRISIAFGDRPSWAFGGYIFMHFTYFPAVQTAFDVIEPPVRILAPNPLQ